jgi:hypothetical protein
VHYGYPRYKRRPISRRSPARNTTTPDIQAAVRTSHFNGKSKAYSPRAIGDYGVGWIQTTFMKRPHRAGFRSTSRQVGGCISALGKCCSQAQSKGGYSEARGAS